ncbi:MAG: hypothetical protein HY709_07020 [Candidatus Latescibacteria bacterium]|nr:hypothetical protein [Candidatus Latescibacterota bacterium]
MSGERVRYLTVLYPQRVGEGDPEMSRLVTNEGDGVLIDRGKQFEVGLVRGDGNEASVLAVVDRDDIGTVWTDGKFGVIGFEGGVARFFEIEDGTVIGVDDRAMAEASLPVTIVGQFGEGMIEGYVRGEGRLITLAVEGGVTDVRFNGESIPFRRSPGGVRFSVEGEGAFVVRSRSGVQGDFNADGVVDFRDFFLFAQAFGTREAVFDLTGDGGVDFRDFLLFAASFNQREEGK